MSVHSQQKFQVINDDGNLFFLQRVLEILRHTGAPKGFSVRPHKEWLKACILNKQTMPKMFVRRYKQKH